MCVCVCVCDKRDITANNYVGVGSNYSFSLIPCRLGGGGGGGGREGGMAWYVSEHTSKYLSILFVNLSVNHSATC